MHLYSQTLFGLLFCYILCANVETTPISGPTNSNTTTGESDVDLSPSIDVLGQAEVDKSDTNMTVVTESTTSIPNSSIETSSTTTGKLNEGSSPLVPTTTERIELDPTNGNTNMTDVTQSAASIPNSSIETSSTTTGKLNEGSSPLVPTTTERIELDPTNGNTNIPDGTVKTLPALAEPTTFDPTPENRNMLQKTTSASETLSTVNPSQSNSLLTDDLSITSTTKTSHIQIVPTVSPTLTSGTTKGISDKGSSQTVPTPTEMKESNQTHGNTNIPDVTNSANSIPKTLIENFGTATEKSDVVSFPTARKLTELTKSNPTHENTNIPAVINSATSTPKNQIKNFYTTRKSDEGSSPTVPTPIQMIKSNPTLDNPQETFVSKILNVITDKKKSIHEITVKLKSFVNLLRNIFHEKKL